MNGDRRTIAGERGAAIDGRMARFALEDLRVYAMAEELADLIWDVVAKWGPFAKNAVGLRASQKVTNFVERTSSGQTWAVAA
jgi:hypothetical protein